MGCRHLVNLLAVSSSERDRSVVGSEWSWRAVARVGGSDDPVAMADDPLLVRRLRRVREARPKARTTASGSRAARR